MSKKDVNLCSYSRETRHDDVDDSSNDHVYNLGGLTFADVTQDNNKNYQR